MINLWSQNCSKEFSSVHLTQVTILNRQQNYALLGCIEICPLTDRQSKEYLYFLSYQRAKVQKVRKRLVLDFSHALVFSLFFLVFSLDC